MRRPLLVLAAACASMLLPTVASADETMKTITIVGRRSRPGVVIEIKRAEPNLGLKPLVAPKSFFSQESK